MTWAAGAALGPSPFSPPAECLCAGQCGVHRDFPGETAVDVEYLADHLPTHHRHHHHLTHKEP